MTAVTQSGKDKTMRWARLYISGYDLSGDARSFGTLANGIAEVERTGWSEAHRNYIADDLRMVGISDLQVMLNDTSVAAYDRLITESNNTIIDLAFGGGGEPAIGDPVYMLRSEQISAVANLDGKLAIMSANFAADTDQYTAGAYNPFGVVLQDAATQITATISEDSVDHGAATTAGAWANLHVLTTASGDYAFKLQDSANDTDWADIVGATWTIDGSAIAAESIEFTANTARYVRFVATRTAGSIYAVCTFGRL
ncbi:MAG TPA: hypothetical protein VMV52_08490 [Candidatus Nanopelagicaceae bacterium]|nr:hypothetical protein [Candidatus Nanopelagicaceae bacterium]